MPATMRPVLTLLLAVVCLGTGASAASAAVTVYEGQRSLASEDVDSEDAIPLTQIDGDAAADHVLVIPDEEGVTVRAAAPGTTITSDGGCSTLTGGGVRCEGPASSFVVADLGAGDDELAVQAAPGAAGPPVELHGGPGNDVLRGGPGDDGLDGGPGDDVLDGGAGSDVADYSAEAAPVQVDAGAGTAQTADGPEQLVAIEGAFGGTGDDVLRASPAGGRLDGGPGADQLLGGAGDDSIVAVDLDRSDAVDGGPGDGPDAAMGGGGADRITASSGDRIDAGPGDDELDVSPEAGRLAASTSLLCGSGTDRVPLHAATLVLGPDCERFAEARQYLTTAGDFAGTLRFTRTSPRALRVSAGQRCKLLQVRLRTARGRVTAVRALRGTAPVGFGVPRGTSSVEAFGCGARRWTLQARLER